MITWLLAASLASERPLSVTAAPPADAGKARVQVALDATTAALPDLPTALKAVVGAGTAKVAGVRPLGGEPVEVVLAFDQSGSFKGHWADAFTLARAWSAALPPGVHVRVLLFGVEVTDAGEGADAAALAPILDAAEAKKPIQGWTRLRSSVRDAIDRASAAAPLDRGGLRQVIVFTDAGEESPAYSIDDVITHARGHNTRVDMVAFVTNSASVARRLDEVKRIAEGTGGALLQVDNVAGVTPELTALASVSTRTRWVDLTFCGVPADRGATFDDTVEIELWQQGSRRAASGPTPLRQAAVAPATAPCEPPPVAAPPPPTPDPAPAPKGWPWWVWWAIPAGLLLLLLLPLLWWATRKKEEPAPVVAPPPAPVAEPSGAHAAFAPVAADGHDPLERLPEIHLDLVGGAAGAKARVRLNKRLMIVGAAPAADVAVEVPQVSTHHATLQLFPNGNLFVRDEGSTNGTFVDGRKLAAGERCKVELGQTISFSRAITYRVGRPDVPTPPAPTPAPRPAKHRTIVAPIAPVKPPGPGEPGGDA